MDFGNWMKKTVKEAHERYAREEAEKYNQAEVGNTEDSYAVDEDYHLYQGLPPSAKTVAPGTWVFTDGTADDDNPIVRGGDISQEDLDAYDRMQQDTDYDGVFYDIAEITNDPDLGYGEHYL